MRCVAWIASLLCAVVIAEAQVSRPRAWHPGLPDDGVVAVSRIGQGKVTRQLFNDCWAAFRTQYYVDFNGAFTPHDSTASSLQVVSTNNYEYYRDMQMRGRVGMAYTRRLEIVGNQAQDGRPVDGFYLVVRQSDQPADSLVGDRRFIKNSDPTAGAMRLYVADPSIVRAGVIDVLCERSGLPYAVAGKYGQDFYREVGMMGDSKELQDSFMDALKAGSIFKVIINRHAVCPYHTQSTWSPGECRACKGKGGADFPHIITLRL